MERLIVRAVKQRQVKVTVDHKVRQLCFFCDTVFLEIPHTLYHTVCFVFVAEIACDQTGRFFYYRVATQQYSSDFIDF